MPSSQQTDRGIYGVFYRQRRKIAAIKNGGRKLRQIALMTAAVAIAIAIAVSGPAEAAWQTYENEPLGYSVMFPAKPSEGTGIYRSDLAPNATTHYATLKDGDSTFIAVVIDTGRLQDGAILMGEIEYWLGHIGDIVLNSISRLNTGMEYGRFLTIDCRDNIVPESPNQAIRARQIFKDAAGLICPNGARLTTNIFFTQGRLYAATGIQTGENAKVSGAPGRFANSFGWVGANADHARTLVDWTARRPTQGGAQAGNDPQTPAASGR